MLSENHNNNNKNQCVSTTQHLPPPLHATLRSPHPRTSRTQPLAGTSQHFPSYLRHFTNDKCFKFSPDPTLELFLSRSVGWQWRNDPHFLDTGIVQTCVVTLTVRQPDPSIKFGWNISYGILPTDSSQFECRQCQKIFPFPRKVRTEFGTHAASTQCKPAIRSWR